MNSEAPHYILSNHPVSAPTTTEEVLAAMTDHTYFLNSWLAARFETMRMAIEVQEEEAQETGNTLCQDVLRSILRELALTQKLLVPVDAFHPSGDRVPVPSPLSMVAAQAHVRAEWVELVNSIGQRP